jgi:hypothetical protein
MPTFLPFRRAVKAYAESLGVCALVACATVSANCVSHGVERAAEGPPTGPVRQAPTGTPTAAAIASDAGTPGVTASASPGTTLGANSALAALPLTFELPYAIDARPRAMSALQAAADDEELERWNTGGTGDPNYVSSQASFHPGTRVIVDTHFPVRQIVKPSTSAHGLSADRIQAQARSHGYWPFRLCFEAGQREKRGLGGETRIRFTIATRGDVSAARLISSELHNATSTLCLVNELRKLRFTPRPARHFDVVASIRIWPGDAELPAISNASPATVDASNGFAPSAVLDRVTSKQTELGACFIDARRTDPSLWGRLALTVVLEVDGSVHRASEVESHFPNAAAAHCAAATLATIVFPSVNGKPFSFVLAMRLPPAMAEPLAPSSAPNSATAAAPDADDAGPRD